jgi:hypothetical protein
MVAVFEPKIIEVVGEASKATVSVYPFVAGRGVGVRDVLEGSFDIKAEVVVDEEFQTA